MKVQVTDIPGGGKYVHLTLSHYNIDQLLELKKDNDPRRVLQKRTHDDVFVEISIETDQQNYKDRPHHPHYVPQTSDAE